MDNFRDAVPMYAHQTIHWITSADIKTLEGKLEQNGRADFQLSRTAQQSMDDRTDVPRTLILELQVQQKSIEANRNRKKSVCDIKLMVSSPSKHIEALYPTKFVQIRQMTYQSFSVCACVCLCSFIRENEQKKRASFHKLFISAMEHMCTAHVCF